MAISGDKAITASHCIQCIHCGDAIVGSSSAVSKSGLADISQSAHQDYDQEKFCCHGCAMAYEIIQGITGNQFYTRVEQKHGNRGKILDYTIFDDPNLAVKYNLEPGADSRPPSELDRITINVKISGITCASCSWLLEKVIPDRFPDLLSFNINYAGHFALISYDPGKTRISEVLTTFSTLGYPVTPVLGIEDLRESTRSPLFRQMMFAGVFFGQMMAISISFWVGWHSIEANIRSFLSGVSFFYASLVILFSAQDILRSLLHLLRHRVISLDVPIAIGILFTYFFSVYRMFFTQEEIYFESAVMLVFFVLLTRWISYHYSTKVIFDLSAMSSKIPDYYLRQEDSKLRHIAEESLLIGDILHILPGQRIPARALILQGEGDVSEAMTSGESLPIFKQKSDTLYADTINLDGNFIVSIKEIKSEMALDELRKFSEYHSDDRDPLAQKISLNFLIIQSIVISVNIGVKAYLGYSAEQIVNNSIVLLIALCPCAISISLPLVRLMTRNYLSQKGVLIKNDSVLSLLAQKTAVFLDKTGTLSKGQLDVDQVIVAEPWQNMQPEQAEGILDIFSYLLHHSQHPTAVSVREYHRHSAMPGSAESLLLTAAKCTMPGHIKYFAGKGVLFVRQSSSAEKVSGAQTFILGSAAFVLSQSGQLNDNDQAMLGDQADSTILVFAMLDEHRKSIELFWIYRFADMISQQSKQLIAYLDRRRIPVCILSGDRSKVVEQVGRELGVAYVRGDLQPEQKLEIIQNQKNEQGRVAVMVGDGLNDIQAFRVADVAITFQGSGSSNFKNADVILPQLAIDRLIDLYRGAKQMSRSLRSSLLFMLFFNIFAISITVADMLNPFLAATFMSVSSIIILIKSFSFRRRIQKTKSLASFAGSKQNIK